MGCEWIEIAVAMKELKAVLDAERGNQAVDGHANDNALGAQEPIILRRVDCQAGGTILKVGEELQLVPELTETLITASPAGASCG